MRLYRTESEEQTISLGRELARHLPEKSVVLLIGDLGAGKTTLAKGIVVGLGATSEEEVSSPTFTLIHEYDARTYHVDLYRLDTEAEVRSLGLDDILDRAGTRILIEWGERFPQLWPAERVEIRLTPDGDARKIQIIGLPESS